MKRPKPGQLTALLAAIAPFVVIGMFLSPVQPPWRAQTPPLRVETISVGGIPLEVELAERLPSQQRGLGYRDGLAPGTGMLFVYDQPAEHSFWMKGMRFCLDIIWLSHDQIIGGTEDICPAPAGTPDSDIPRTVAPEPVPFVLEVPSGWMRANNVTAGDPVELPSNL